MQFDTVIVRYIKKLSIVVLIDLSDCNFISVSLKFILIPYLSYIYIYTRIIARTY